MASISKFSTALLSVPNELTVAAANFNLNFSLMKVEAPPEFHGLRDVLSHRRRREAEEGIQHITARCLGALFESLIPSVPRLTAAYGKRVSEISEQLNPDSLPAGMFADRVGADGTSIWAAATSGQHAIAMHLLACMLARIWKPAEATSLWVELVERRKQEIFKAYNSSSAAHIPSIMAAQQLFTRDQLSAWDASARSWLQAADAAKRLEQTQLMLIINNVRKPVNTSQEPYESVVTAWTSGMDAMERLICGTPQRVQDGAILVAITAWHLYPNMQVLSECVKDVNSGDELMAHSLLTISSFDLSGGREGVFWSLPLSRMRYYSPPVITERSLASDTSRISMEEFQIVFLGAFVARWNRVCSDEERCCKLIIRLQHVYRRLCANVPQWFSVLADAATRVIESSGSLKAQNRCINKDRLSETAAEGEEALLIHPEKLDDVDDFQFLIGMPGKEIQETYTLWLGHGQLAAVFRRQVGPTYDTYSQGVSDMPSATIEEIETVVYSDDFDPMTIELWSSCYHASGHGLTQLMRSLSALTFMTNLYESMPDSTVSIEVINGALYSTAWVNSLKSIVLEYPYAHFQGLWWHYDEIVDRATAGRSQSLGSQSPMSYYSEDESKVTKTAERVLTAGHEDAGDRTTAKFPRRFQQRTHISGKVVHMEHEKVQESRGFEMRRVFSCIAWFESGEFDLSLENLHGVMALANGASIYAASALLVDPSARTKDAPVRRVFGNLGRSELCLLVPPADPRLAKPDVRSWKLINHSAFDGQFQDCFGGTTLHLTFTESEDAVYVGNRGLRDRQVVLLEALISIDDRGRNIGDLDILSMFVSPRLRVKRTCAHVTNKDVPPVVDWDLIAVDCWEEFLDPPTGTGIFRASGNWQARLGAAAAAIQAGKNVLVLPEKACLLCLWHSVAKDDVDIIIA
ncbi:unnamed protein product [Alternaria alternata]